jgi:hypothetical protein
MTMMSLRHPRACREEHIRFVDLVVIPEGPHPIPFRTRSLSLFGPMVLRLKARESRSPPGLQSGCGTFISCEGVEDTSQVRILQSRRSYSGFDAGWSSPVARQAHNLKVAGSNPAPAPKSPPPGSPAGVFLCPMNRKLGPARLGRRGGLVERILRRRRISPKAEGEQVFQSQGREQLELAVGRQPGARREQRRGEPRQRLCRAGKGRVGPAEVALEPQVHTRLVSHLHQVAQSRRKVS